MARQGELTLRGGRAEAPPAPVSDPPRPDWRALYKELQRDWNTLLARSQDPDLPLPLMQGYDALIGRVRALAQHSGLSQHARGVLDELLAYDKDETVARETARGWLADAERHVERWKALERRADEKAMAVARMDDYRAWREAARTLAATGEAILGNEERYGAYLDALTIGKPRARLVADQLRDRIEAPRNSVGEWLAAARRHMEARVGLTASKGYPQWREEAVRLMKEGKDILSGRTASRVHADGEPTTGERLMRRALSQLGETIGKDDRRTAARKARARRERATEWSRLRFADEPGGAAAARPRAGRTNEVPEWAEASRPLRALARDGQAATERSGPASLERWQRLKRQWNRQLDSAGKQGVHVIYTKGFGDLHRHLRSMAERCVSGEPHLREDRGRAARAGGGTGEARARGEHARPPAGPAGETRRGAGVRQLPGHAGRSGPPRTTRRGASATDEAVAAAEDILADQKAYGMHLDVHRSAPAGEDWTPRSRACARFFARTTGTSCRPWSGRRKGEDVAARQEGIAHILDDPEKLQ